MFILFDMKVICTHVLHYNDIFFLFLPLILSDCSHNTSILARIVLAETLISLHTILISIMQFFIRFSSSFSLYLTGNPLFYFISPFKYCLECNLLRN